MRRSRMHIVMEDTTLDQVFEVVCASMYVARIHIEGFKRFKSFDLELNPSVNIIVGDNETGKSSLLEAIGLVLTGQYNGRSIQQGLDPYLFNMDRVREYFERLRNGETLPAPSILIEAYLATEEAAPEFSKLRGTNNTRGEDSIGLSLAIEVDRRYVDELREYASDDSNPDILPVEFYTVNWYSFANNGVSLRALPFRTATIDTSLPRVYRGPNRYLAQVVHDVLSDSQRRELSLEYKRIRHRFAQEPAVQAINKHLEQQGNRATSRRLSLQMDISSRASWESTITAHLDDLPFDCIGRGEQSRVQLRLAIAGAENAQVLLIEEPENHLSHSNLNRLLEDIKTDCADRQVIMTTHSTFVLNKLGVDHLRLISHGSEAVALDRLTSDTKEYFMKLPGYDTLRMILARRCILVEGPSDELIVQRAYMDRHGKVPLEDGVDVISVGSLAFKRFLEVASLLGLEVRVLIDNDGDVDSLRRRYAEWLGQRDGRIRIFYDDDESCKTLEDQLVKANSLSVLNRILGTSYEDEDELLKYMKQNKTDCALRMFETECVWSAPEYIRDAIE